MGEIYSDIFLCVIRSKTSQIIKKNAEGRDRGQVSVLPIFLRLRARRGFSAGHCPVPCTVADAVIYHKEYFLV